VGDVSGKGLTAAVHVATAKYSIRSHAYETDSPGRVMEMVNETMLRETDAEGFITIFAGVLDTVHRTLIYTNCGHEPVIRWKSAEGKAVLLAPNGPIIGAIPGISCREDTIALEPGDEIILGTDGLFEIRCGEGRLEVEGLLDLFTELKKSGNGTAIGLIERVSDYCDGDLRDDVAILRVVLEKDVPDEAGIWPTGL
jgi:phosphoserine phosphatase RsbU/P